MPKKQRKFADDGWAVWIDGNDTSTIYINDWLAPKGKSYVDMAIHIRGVKESANLYVYVPFRIFQEEIEDVSLFFKSTRFLQAIFSAAGIVDFKKNKHTSEIAYNGKTVDIVHISTLDYKVEPLADGTLISIDLETLQPFIDNEEAYFIWRMPHKSLDEIFKVRVDATHTMRRMRDLLTSPVVAEKYGYSIRINEARLLPEEITRIGAFHRQKNRKAIISLAIDENYELNDAGCYRISRLEEDLYMEYLPKDYKSEDVIVYQWGQNREDNAKGQFNFYYNIAKNSVSRESIVLYIISILAIAVVGNFVSNLVFSLLGLFT
jgi:hypothetical protein